ncbi:hypothetical protein CROQUDRAFT_255314 [Cronartium quercuum f. sp. fusiforme G11]|uniref:Uncharacterized protein n=1 Tax=Cronartium quercuum f. sp. fusiforme G11 TaxID=708437 RepID=A0A9P6NE37_9BASI|nr:hypothetical protein CROQUDRAFT_255314 [Cronartium quercuum f. sp. fusiforme G11]
MSKKFNLFFFFDSIQACTSLISLTFFFQKKNAIVFITNVQKIKSLFFFLI